LGLSSTLKGRGRALAGRAALVLLVLLIVAAVEPRLSFVEMRAYDLLLSLRPTRPPDPRVAIVDAGDPEAFASLRDPRDTPESGCKVPRRAYAEAVRRLHRWGPKVIVFDVMFGRSCPFEDVQLAEACREAGNVVVAAATKVEPRNVGLQDPAKPIAGAVWAVGSPVAHQPNEGTVRSVPLMVRDRDTGRAYPSLSLAALEYLRGVKASEANLDGAGWLTLPGLKVPLLAGEKVYLFGSSSSTAEEPDDVSDSGIEVVKGSEVRAIPRSTSWNAMLINWAGPGGTISPQSLRDLLDMSDAEGRELYADKAVIIGGVDWDVWWTAVGAMPGLEIQANALQTLISGSFLRPLSSGSLLGLLALFCFATASAVRRFRGVRELGAMLFLMLLGLVVARQLLVSKGVWVYLFACELSIGLTWALTTFLESGRAATLLGRFVPAFLGKPGAGELGEIRTLDATLLFSDIRGFTGTAERLSAKDTMTILNRYQSAVEDVIHRYGGTIVKTPGDAILAVFWKDVGKLNPATAAVRAGQEMLQGLPLLARAWEKLGVNLEIGIGINAGEVAMGLVGTRHLEPTVIGDPVNVASRLESLTKTLECPLIFSESVRTRLSAEIEVAELEEVTVRGREAPLRVYTLRGLEGASRTESAVARETRE